VNDLFDLMTRAQGGQAIDNLARQYGVQTEQMQSLVQALLPAYSAALKQATAGPAALTAFLQALGSGRHASFFDDPRSLGEGRARDEGEGIMGHVFGPPEVVQAVAEQTATLTGIGANIVRQVMPAIAAMIMGGLFRQSQGAGFQGMMEDMIRQMTGTTPQPRRQAPANPFEDILGQMMESITQGGQSVRRSGEQSGGRRPTAGESETRDHPSPDREPDTAGERRGGSTVGERYGIPPLPQTGADLFGAMMETNRQIRNAQVDAMEKWVDSFFPVTPEKK
jgi:hypothetical protein